MDGSLMPDGKTVADYEYNVEVTPEVVRHAHARGVAVEGELGTLGGIEDGVGSGEVHLTDPDQAVDFVQRTGIDALAVAIGTSHGAYKFNRKPDAAIDPRLFTRAARDGMRQIVAQRMRDFGQAGHAGDYEPRLLAEMRNRYDVLDAARASPTSAAA